MPLALMYFAIVYLLGVLGFQSDYSMVVTYGEPTTAWDPIPIDTSSWDTCVRKCYLDTYCVMAHQTPQFCHHYQIRKVYGAKKLTVEDGSLIAIKVATGKPKLGNKSSSAPCASTLSDVSQTVYLKNSTLPKGVSISYKLQYSSEDGTWSINYSVLGYCDKGWQVFFRPNAIYCITVITNFTRIFNSSMAIQGCEKLQATLAGFETNEERIWVTNQVAINLSQEKSYSIVAIWVSGARKSTCRLSTSKEDVACQGIKAFSFDDPYIRTASGYLFEQGQPDSYITSVIQNCIQLWVSKQLNSTKHGMVDDQTCGYTSDGKNYALRGYTCGKKA